MGHGIFFVALFLFLSSPSWARPIERIVAIVNDQILLSSDIELFRKRLSSEGLVDDFLLQLVDRSRLLKDRQALIAYLIDERVLDSEVKKRGLDITFERVEQEIRSILKEKHINRSQLKDVLLEKGATMAEYQAFIKTSIERRGLIEREVSSRIKISDDDVAAYYLSRRGAKQNQAYEYSLAHILFLPTNGGDRAARERLAQAQKKLQDGQAFDSVAEQFSEDPTFSQGGILGNFRSGEMSKEFEDGVRTVTVGAVSGPVKTKAGIHLIKVIKKSMVADPELDERREEIRGLLFADVFKKQFRAWLDQRREDAFIRLNEVPNAKVK